MEKSKRTPSQSRKNTEPTVIQNQIFALYKKKVFKMHFKQIYMKISVNLRFVGIEMNNKVVYNLIC